MVAIIIGGYDISEAQIDRRPIIYLNGGFSIPLNPYYFTKNWDLGFNMTGGLGYPINSFLTIRGSFEFHNFPPSTKGYAYNQSLSGGEQLIFGPAVTLIASVPSRGSYMGSYFIGGVGLNRFVIRDIEVRSPGSARVYEGDTGVDYSIFIGHGYNFALSKRIKLFVEGRYVVCLRKSTSNRFLPASIGLMYK